MRKLLSACLLLIITASASHAAARIDTLACIADAPMNGYSGEKDLNYGASPRMRMKDYQGIPFMQFDFEPLRGMRAVSCTLFVRSADGEEAFCTDIISTIAAVWYEGSSNGAAETGASTFSTRVWPDSLWAGTGSDARSVINGDNGSLVNPDTLCFPEGGGWASVVIAPGLAQQLIDGGAHGLALFGKDIQYNRDVYAREQAGSAPYVVIEVTEGESVPPAAVRDLSVARASDHGRITLAWTATGDDSVSGTAALYDFRVSSAALDEQSWSGARPLAGAPEPAEAGEAETWEVGGLEPGETYYIAMRARDESLNWSGISNVLRATVPLDTVPPGRIDDLAARGGEGPGEVVLSWSAPGDDNGSGRAASYELRISGSPIDSGNWESAGEVAVLLTPGTADTAQSYTVAGLTPGATYHFAIRAVDDAGLAGALSPSASAEAARQGIALWAAPPYWKINPVNGNAFECGEQDYTSDDAPAPYRTYNNVWDGASSRVRLAGGGNEFVGFQVVVEAPEGGSLAGVDIEAGALTGPAAIAAENIHLYREWYHQFEGAMYPDLLVPFRTDGGGFTVHPFAVPDPQITTFQGIVQRNQALYVDVYIPHDTPAGTYEGVLTVSADGLPVREVTLEVRVLDFELSDRVHYGVEFNCYGDIAPGWKISHDWDTAALHDSLERVVQRELHVHRTYMNRMPYSHNPSRQASFRCAPELNGASGESLSISDWTEYDKRFGPYFDGSAFAGNPRDGVPIPFYYLPFHTEWPVPMPQPRGPSVFSDQDYIAGWTKVVGEFERHIAEKGWSGTSFFCYQNEKEHYGYQPWDLDEPTRPEDYEALNFFAGMFHQGLSGDIRADMLYRCDMGHFSYMNGELDEAVDIWVINRGDYPESRVRERLAEGDIAWTYGDAPMITENMAENYYDFFVNWARGARGYCYWNSFSAWGDDAWNDNNDGSTNIFYPGMAGYTDMVGHVLCPSLRMKAIRDAAEMMEMLHLMGNSTAFTVRESEDFAARYRDKEMATYESAEQALKLKVDGLGSGTPDPPLPGERVCDFSGDGTISTADLVSFLLLARKDRGHPSLDLNHDGRYTILDALRLLIDITRGACSGTALLASAELPASERALIESLDSGELAYLEECFSRMGLNAEQQALIDNLLSSAAGGGSLLPRAFSLSQNYPNPFNPSTTISYTVPEGERVQVSLVVYSLRGSLVRRLVDGEREAGTYTVMWDGTDSTGGQTPSGVYFYRLCAGDYSRTRKMVLVK